MKCVRPKEHLLKEAVEKIPLHSETLSPSGNDQPPVVTPTVSEYVRSRAEKERRQIFHGDRRLRYERV
ncbi:MAG: hypothetical protein M3X11_14710 [Acidobacteriota bacterium]|nr:hypothetical protein [Acidobacteriota bacterium]